MALFSTFNAFISANNGAGAFKTFSYTGNGTSQTFTQPNFKPDLIIIVSPSAISGAVNLPVFDSGNGVGTYMDLSGNRGQAADVNSVTSFNTIGFSIGSSAAINKNGSVYQAFCWQKASHFFDIATYTGNATNRTINHNLGISPSVMIANNTNGVFEDFNAMYHQNMGTSAPETHANLLGGGAAISTLTDSTIWNATAPTSSVISVGTSNYTNENGAKFYDYLFGTFAGKSAFGTYTGNGSSSGPIVTSAGFAPTLVMISAQTCTSQNVWFVYGSNLNTKITVAAASSGISTSNLLNFTPSGFNVVTNNADFNTNGTPYIYSAWA